MTAAGVLRVLPALGWRSRARPWRRAGARPRVWAHRGDSAHATENTLEAFHRARHAGADGIELDVRLTRDGQVVVFHDDDLRRLAGRPERVADLTWDELAAVELVHGRTGGRACLLSDALAAAGPLDVNVEIKSPGPGRAGHTPGATAAEIQRSGAAARVVVSSFDPWALVQVRRPAPALATALLFHAELPLPARRGWVAPWVGAALLHPEHVLCSAATVSGWRRAGYAVNVWTVDDPDRLRTLASWGVDGVFCNDPAAARAALDGRG